MSVVSLRSALKVFTATLGLLLHLSTGALAQGLEYNIDRPGQDYSSFDLSSPDPALCQSACLADPQCRAFTYVNPGVQGSSARCWLKNGVPDQVANTCCVSGVSGSAPPPTDGRFQNPQVNGYAVDICLNFSANCEKPAADEFCRRQGFAGSVSHTIQPDTPPTLILGDNAICSEGFCDRFSEIVCGSASTPPPPPPPEGNADELWRMSASQHRGKIGQQFSYSCPSITVMPSVTVWGSGTYTDDSSVCVAAVHAGLITATAGGSITIEITAGLASYSGSTQNGVTSSSYGSWDGSYVFPAAGGGSGGGGGGSGGGGSGGFPPADEAAAIVGQDCAGPVGTQCTFGCPPGMTLGTRLWGTGVYTDDSNVCTAAVHAGAITQAGGGFVTIVIGGGHDSYAPSTQNGITSSGWGRWERSFTIAGTTGGGGGGGGGAGGPCANPRTQQVMDQWLTQAIPTAEGNLRYEPWGRAIGTTPSARISVSGPPDTHLSRCEYLLQQAASLPSRNLGTLQEFLQQNGVL
jgi:hypothetical protein